MVVRNIRLVGRQVVIVILCTAHLEATLIIAVRQDDKITIAADSLRVTYDREPMDWGVCKIKNFSDIVFASSGINEHGSFSIDILSELLLAPIEANDGRSRSLRARIKRFEEATMAAWLAIEPDLIAANIHEFAYLLGFFEDGIPVVMTHNMVTGEKKEAKDGVRYMWIGEHSFADKGPGVLESAVKNKVDLQSALTVIIGVEAEISTIVGGLVDRFRLTANGGEWIQKKRECREEG